MRRFFIILVVLLLVATGGWFGYQRSETVRAFIAQQLNTQPVVAQQPTYITAQARRDSLATTVSATGNLAAAAPCYAACNRRAKTKCLPLPISALTWRHARFCAATGCWI